MDEYIKRDDAISAARFAFVGQVSALCAKSRVIFAIEGIPSQDVVEVVRCKDCKHFISEVCRHDFAMNLSRGDDFCSYGERNE